MALSAADKLHSVHPASHLWDLSARRMRESLWEACVGLF